MSYVLVRRLVVNPKAREWCRLPYPGHPKGCPMYGRRPVCPPQAPMVQDYFDLSRPLFIVWSEFNLEAHAQAMGQFHPEWSERQRRCVLYWQPKARQELKHNVDVAMMQTEATSMTYVPEAMGVNVYATCTNSGLRLERIRDLKIDRHVALIGHPKFKKGLMF